MIDTLIFDWDGTLHNTKHLYGSAFRTAYNWLVSEGYAPRRYYTDEEISIYLGMNSREMWQTFMPHLPQHMKEKASELVGREMLVAVNTGKAELYPGTMEMLETLKQQGFRMVFLSNCKHAYMDAHRKWFHLDRWFTGYYCCQDYDFIPKEQIFLDIQKDFPGKYVVIGDRESDLEVAKVHGLVSIGCAYGFGTAEELKMASLIVDNVSQIPEKITILCGN